MGKRVYGPTLGAGVRLEEEEAQKQLQPGQLGVTYYVGPLERGPKGSLIMLVGPSDLARKTGGRIRDSLVPDAAQDFWSTSEGAGVLCLQRVTDGSDQQAALVLLNRAAKRVPCIRVKAGSGGSWAGKRAEYSGEVESTAVEATSVDTGLTLTGPGAGIMYKDRFAGALFRFVDLARTYTVTGNSTAGVLQFAADQDLAADLAEEELTGSLRWELELSNSDYLARDKRLEVEVRDGIEQPSTEFGLYFYLDGARFLKYPNLSMDPASPRYFEKIINEDPGNYSDVEVEDLWAPNSPTAAARPANGYGETNGGLTAVRLTLEDPEVTVDSAATGRLFDDAAVEEATTSVVTIAKSAVPGVAAGAAAGTIAASVRTTNSPPVEAGDAAGQLASWSLSGVTLVNSDDGVLYFDLADAAGDRTVNLYSDSAGLTKVATGTRTGDGAITLTAFGGSGITGSVTVTYTTDDLTVSANTLTVINPAAVETRTLAAAQPVEHPGDEDLWDFTVTVPFSVAPSGTVDLTVLGTPAPVVSAFTYGDAARATTFKLTVKAGGAGYTVEDLGGCLKDLPDGTLGAAYAAPSRFGTGWTVTNSFVPLVEDDAIYIRANSLREDALVGGRLWPDAVAAPNESYEIIENAARTVTVRIGSDMTKGGSRAPASTPYRLQYPEALEGGYDGLADLGDADYQQALDPNEHPLLELEGMNMGLVKMAAPGADGTAVQKAGAALAEALNYQWRYTLPENIEDEVLAVEHINGTLGRNDFAVAAFPSYAYVPDPDGASGTFKLVDTAGMIHGREARVAKNFSGYHKAAAGVDVTLPRISSLPLPATKKKLNEELLNPHGVQVLKKKAGNYVVWGDRTVSVDPAWKWKHQREQMSHYERQLQEAFDWIVFAINDPDNDAVALAALEAFFKPEWRPKRALRGAKFSDACTIKVDKDINTDETRAAGDQNAQIRLRLADTVERFVIRIGKMGIFEEAA